MALGASEFAGAALVLLIGLLLPSCDAGCYFSAELQGEFVMQLQFQGAQPGQPGHSHGLGHVQYSTVNISADNIPIWGRCHRRLGNNVILMDSSGSANCIRCFHLRLVARNVLQVHTEELSKCYTTEEAAERTCPDEAALRKRSKQILLYKTKELDGEDVIKEYCPVSGRFTFTYNVNDGLENKQECPTPMSQLDNCPNGNALNVRFRGCSFENHDITFECLGHWAGPGGERYLALLDTRVDTVRRAQYRCAMYREDEATGVTSMAFSSDSTCSTDLHSAEDGYETLTLHRAQPKDWPPRVQVATCLFPSWAHGRWQHMTITRNMLTFRDHTEMKTFSARCIGPDQGPSVEFVPIFYRTQCGEEKFTCVWLKPRGNNVLEFQMGVQSSDRFNNSLCSPSNFREKVWVTQGRTDDRVKESPCPITGEYTGQIPDAIGLCAKLSSDCAHPEVMYYTVSDCNTEVYEGRPAARYTRRHSSARQRREAAADTDAQPSPFSTATASAAPTSTSTMSAAAPTSAARIYRISSSPRDQQQEASAAASWSGSFGRRAGPMYPTSYNAHLNLTTSTASPSPGPRLAPVLPDEEEYDPWAYPRMHGLQTTSQAPRQAPRPRPGQSAVAPHANPVMYFRSQSGFRDPAGSSANPHSQFSYSTSTPPSAREVAIGWPTLRPDLAATSASAGPIGPAVGPAGPAATPGLGAGASVGAPVVALPAPTAISGTMVGVVPVGLGAVRGQGSATGSSYRGRPVEIPGLPPSPYLESRSGSGSGSGFAGRMRIVPMAVPGGVPGGSMSLSARAPTDRGMEFGERATTGRRALQPQDSGWTLEGPMDHGGYGALAAPRMGVPRSPASVKTQERQYRCLGQWKEGELVYTYTQRRDVGTYECFVGSIVSQNEIYIKEAGEHCERDLVPSQQGMLLRRKGACIGSAPIPQSSSTPSRRPRPTTPWPITKPRTETTTKPWSIVPPRPTKPPVQSSASSLHSTVFWLVTSITAVMAINL